VDLKERSTRKIFAANNNTTVALTGANVQDTANSPGIERKRALDLATATSATIQSSGRAVKLLLVPATVRSSLNQQRHRYGANSGALAPGAAPNISNAQGVVLRLTLPAATPSYKGSANLRTQGKLNLRRAK